jgi:osmotically-inducible protein OsmY
MRYLTLLFLVLMLGLLQGCFPIIATGVGTGALMASDRRTTGTYIEDEGIELKAGGRISNKYGDTVHVNVTSFNRRALITGEVPNEAAKNDIAQIVAGVENVKSVSNELSVSGLSSLSSRGNDTLITSDVKLRFLNNGKTFRAEHIKVVTENGVVFLMGLVYHKEADAASEIASTTKGVLRVVKVFEYLD